MANWQAWCIAAAIALGGATAAPGAEPPLDVFTDEQWQTTLLGLSATPPRRIGHDEALFDPRTGEVLSTQRVEFGFDESGRLVQASLRRDARGERTRQHAWRYQRDIQGRLVQIDEDGTDRPALARRFDDRGRLVEERRATGALTTITRWRHDTAGREVERIESGGGHETVVRTRYRRDGSRERQITGAGLLRSSDMRFDAQGRPARMVIRDLTERRTTTVEYPHPRRAVHTIVATGLSKDGGYRNEWVRTFEVRRPDELTQWPEPSSPELRAERFRGQESSTRTVFDVQGRVMRQIESAGSVERCRNEFRYHPSGLPESITATAPNGKGPCSGAAQAVEFEIETDERGRWTRHVIHMTDARGQRVRMAEHRRQIEDR